MIKNAQVGVRVHPSAGSKARSSAAIGVHSGNHPSQRGRTSIMTAIRGEGGERKTHGGRGKEGGRRREEVFKKTKCVEEKDGSF